MAGRHVVQVEVGRAVGVEPWPGVEFARRHGFTLALREEHHVLRLVRASRVPSPDLANGYAGRTWRAHCPDELVAAYCRLRERFAAHAPTGDLMMGEQVWDSARVRATEQARVGLGRSSWTSAAVAPDGQLVGFTDLMGTAGSSDVFQNQTLVLPEHRQQVHTWVSPGNAHMRSVNDAFGFEPVELLEEWQRDLAD